MKNIRKWIGRRTDAFFYWYRAYSFLFRAGLVIEWVGNPKNARPTKWFARGLGLIIVATAGFLGRAAFDVLAEREHDVIVLFAKFCRTFIPPSLHPFLVEDYNVIVFAIFEVLLVALLGIVFAIIFVAIRQSRIVTAIDTDLRKETPAVRALLSREGQDLSDYFAVGGVVEIGRHPFICSDPSLSGWDVSDIGNAEVIIEHDMGADVIVDESLIKDIPNPAGHNGRKFSLVATPVDYLDASPRLSIQVRSTDYYLISRFLRLIKNQVDKDRLVSIFPEHNQVPNSLCLHYIVQLADGNLLCSMRNANTDYSQGQVSISGEEQISQEDIDARPAGVASHWFRRAICEEVFPLRLEAQGGLHRAWEKLARHITTMRIFSIIYEEYCANYALVGFCRINLDLHSFRAKYDALRKENLSGRDKEGTFFVASKNDLIKYMTAGKCKLRSVWGCRELTVDDHDESLSMHPTSRYRALAFLQAVGALNERSITHPYKSSFDYSLMSVMRDRVNALETQVEELKAAQQHVAGDV